MNYEKIDVREKNYMSFYKEHKHDTECMYYGGSRYVKVVNKEWSLCYPNVETVVPNQRNNQADEVAHGRET
jgi:hypothetical protein